MYALNILMTCEERCQRLPVLIGAESRTVGGGVEEVRLPGRETSPSASDVSQSERKESEPGGPDEVELASVVCEGETSAWSNDGVKRCSYSIDSCP